MKTPHRFRAMSIRLFVAGVLCALLGLAVMLGWHLQQAVLVQIRPQYAPMAYNTALTFVLIGIGMSAAALRCRRIAMATGLAVSAVALLTLTQYLFGVNLRIDELLMRHFVATGMSSPGRMAPNTGIGFLFVGVALILIGRRRQTDRHRLTTGLLSTAVLALGATALFGYLTAMEPMYSWASWSPMALHTAVVFLVIGAALIGYAWRREAARRLPVLVVCGFTIATVILWQALIVQEQAQVHGMVRGQLQNIRYEIETRLLRRVDALNTLAGRWEQTAHPLNEREWEFEAALILRHFPGYQAIAWIDADLRLRRIAPLQENETAIGVQQARDLLRTSRPQTVALRRMPRSPTLNVYVPVYREQRLQGFVVGVFDAKKTVLTERVAPDYAIAVFEREGDDDDPIYLRTLKEAADKWAQTLTLDVYGASWRLRAAPNQELVSELTTVLPTVVLLGGLLLSGLLGWTVYLIQMAQRRARQVEKINRDLNREIREHEKTAAELQSKTELIQLLLTATIAANEAHTAEEALQLCLDHICTLKRWPVGYYLSVHDRQLRPVSNRYCADARFKDFCEASRNIAYADRSSLPNVVLESGKPAWTMNLAQQMGPLADTAQALGLRTALAFPILIKTEVAGIFVFLSTHAIVPEPQLLEVMAQIGVQLGHVIERARADALIHRLNADLERRVQARTGELQREVGERKHAEDDAKTRALQQAAVAEIGQRALAGLDIPTLMQEVATCTARMLEVEYSKILQLSDDGRTLLLRAGVGWKRGLVGKAKVDARNESQGGYALASKGPVIVQDLTTETRFRGMALLRDHGVVSGMSVIIEDDVRRPFGVLGAHSGQRRNFTHDDINFLQAMANVLASALARQRTEALLAQEKERLAVTLQSIGDGVITTDTEGRVVLINKVAQTLTGWSEADARGRPLSEIFPIVHERTREPRENPVQHVLKTGETVQLANHTMLLARDGAERVIADSGAPIRDRDNRILGVVLVFRDITAQQNMEANLLKAQKLESIGVLAGGIAHDFNNILTAILGNVALARMYAQPGDKVYEALSEAEKAFWRARDLTQQLLTFAKGGAPIKRKGTISEIVMDSTRFGLSGTHVRSEYDFPSELWPVEHDPGQISQVINNLVINAVQAMPEGGVLRIAAENITLKDSSLPLPPGRYVKLAIRDEGVGISAQHLSKIFDPYFTTKQKGSGLGLATVYSIIKRHDGHIEVESRIGIGTIFTIYLPAADLAADALEKSVDDTA